MRPRRLVRDIYKRYALFISHVDNIFLLYIFNSWGKYRE